MNRFILLLVIGMVGFAHANSVSPLFTTGYEYPEGTGPSFRPLQVQIRRSEKSPVRLRVLTNFLDIFLKKHGLNQTTLKPDAGPKLLIDLADAGGEILIIRFESSHSGRFLPVNYWNRQFAFSPEAAEAKALDTLSESFLEILKVCATRSAFSEGTAPIRSFSFHPDHLKSTIALGLSLGSPALLNLSVGFWGHQTLPLHVELSGMYLGAAHRGLMLSGHYLLTNGHAVRHGPGLQMGAMNETTVGLVDNFDVYGRKSGVTEVTVHALKPAFGPHYVFRWNYLQGGLGLLTPFSSAIHGPWRWQGSLGFLLPL